MTPRPPDSTGKLSSADTNPLPASSARAWSNAPKKSVPVALPKATPIIREKVMPPRRVRADGTEEICADDIMVIVPKASAPRAKAPSYDALDSAEIIVEESAPEREPFRTPAVSVNVTQEILAEDVLAVQKLPEERPSERPSAVPAPWVVDNDLEFPTPPQYSGPYPAMSSGPRLTAFSSTQVFRRRSANMKIVIASLSAAVAVVAVAGLARMVPTAGADGPVGIAVREPKKLDKSIRGRVLAYGNAPKVQGAETISIDALPTTRRHR